MNPPDNNAIVLSVDEKIQIQAHDRSQPELPLTFVTQNATLQLN